jgi:hypothetical protein
MVSKTRCVYMGFEEALQTKLTVSTFVLLHPNITKKYQPRLLRLPVVRLLITRIMTPI